MNRRSFLKLTGTVSATVAAFGIVGLESGADAAVRPDPQLTFNGLVYRGTADGKILVSHDNAASWKVHSDFGPAYAIDKLANTGGKVRANVMFGRRPFALTLSDANHWTTT